MISFWRAGFALGVATALTVGIADPPPAASASSRAAPIVFQSSLGPVRPLQCVAAPDGQIEDQDGRGQAPGVWRTTKPGLTLYVSTQGLPVAYVADIETAASYWSRSACLSVIPVQQCPENVACVEVEARKVGGGAVDGTFEGRHRGGYLVAGKILLFIDILDQESPSARLATAVHEMGHALGLNHRRSADDVMAATTSSRINPQPDNIDYRNVAVVYGVATTK